jgi:hypothetical protein
VIDVTVAEQNRLSKITFSMNEANVAMQLRRPWVMIGRDAGGVDPDSARGLTHPRAYGTFARVLGKYVRDDSLLTLEDGVRQMTSFRPGARRRSRHRRPAAPARGRRARRLRERGWGLAGRAPHRRDAEPFRRRTRPDGTALIRNWTAAGAAPCIAGRP